MLFCIMCDLFLRRINTLDGESFWDEAPRLPKRRPQGIADDKASPVAQSVCVTLATSAREMERRLRVPIKFQTPAG